MVSVIVKLLLRITISIYSLFMRLLPRKKIGCIDKKDIVTVLLTGTFYSENWIMNHLRPIAQSSRCGKVLIVTTFPVPRTEKVEIIYPSKKLIRVIGKVPARLITFMWIAVKMRPDYIGGFHLLLNGLLAGMCARIVGARSLYFCGGGPREVLDGGIHGSTLFGMIKNPDRYLECKLIAAVGGIDHVITMGSRTIDFFRNRGVKTNFSVIPGGIPKPDSNLKVIKKNYDIIFIGRLEQVKRVDLLLNAIKLISTESPTLKAVLVGTGSLENELKKLTETLGINQNVEFVGYQRDVYPWLFKSKIFVITSDSEGLPLSLMEAMTAGLPGVVSDVGEMGEIIVNGVNGYLVKERSAQAFADQLNELINRNEHYNKMAVAALDTAKRFEISNTSAMWDKIFVESNNAALLLNEVAV